MTASGVGDLIALVNAGLNASSAVALAAGFVLIRRRRVRAHRTAMLVALGASAVFLVFYLTRVGLTGTHEFAGQGLARTIYLGILFTHMILAAVIVPLVLRLVYLVRAGRFRAHARLARWVLPVWAYVSVTGLLVYLLLYRIYGYS